MSKTLSECNTPHEQIEYLCNRWIDLAKTYNENETARDHLHGVWCALKVYDINPETLKMVQRYESKCVARRDELRGEL